MASHLEISAKGAPSSRHELGSGLTVIGRSESADLRVVGDPHVSRRHAEIMLQGYRLRVRKLSEASNPIYHAGAPKDEFSLPPGDCRTRWRRPPCPTAQ